MKKSISIIVFMLFTLLAKAQHQDCILWYDKPASNWHEALPVGNGRLGAMVFGDYRREVIQLNEESLWAGSKCDANADAADKLPEIQGHLLDGEVGKAVELSEKYLKSDPLRIRSYQSFGDLLIDFPIAGVKNYNRQLNLETGIASVSYEMDNVVFKRELFASSVDNLIALRISANQPGKLTFRLQYTREQDAVAYPVGEKELGVQGQIFDLPEQGTGASGLHMKFAGRICGFNKGGNM